MGRMVRLLIGIPVCFTLLVVWVAWSTFSSAPRIATENLRGAGLSIAAGIEQLAVVDSSLQSLARYSTPDIAYFALVDRHGTIRFHTNQHLIGQSYADFDLLSERFTLSESRERLGTGEVVYLLRTKVHRAGDEELLVLALHTYRSDEVIRRANTVVIVAATLTVTLWGVTLVLLRMLRREERHRAEMARREEMARLGELGAVMAHEIRNPLAGIKGFAQLVQVADDLAVARRHADKIVTQSLRMESLVDDLLAFVRDDQGARESVDLCQLIRECANLVRLEADAQGVTVTEQLPPSCEAAVAVDRLLQMLLNLMKNALQAMPEGGELFVTLSVQGSEVRISVRDTGSGIPPEHHASIFEPFWTSKARGTGLGLSLCRKVAEEHGGSLTVTSTVGSGTEFIVTLPVRN